MRVVIPNLVLYKEYGPFHLADIMVVAPTRASSPSAPTASAAASARLPTIML